MCSRGLLFHEPDLGMAWHLKIILGHDVGVPFAVCLTCSGKGIIGRGVQNFIFRITLRIYIRKIIVKDLLMG